jgi:hypothetical protein
MKVAACVFCAMFGGAAVVGRVLAVGFGKEQARTLRGWGGASLGTAVFFFCILAMDPPPLMDPVLVPVWGVVLSLGVGALVEGLMELARLKYAQARSGSVRRTLLMLFTGSIIFAGLIGFMESVMKARKPQIAPPAAVADSPQG